MDIEKQWELFQEQYPVENVPVVTDDELREALNRDLGLVSTMTVGEYTLHQKWLEVKQKYPTTEVQTLFGTEKQLVNLDQERILKEVQSNMWKPKDVDDYMNLQPRMVWTDDSGVDIAAGLDGDIEVQRARSKDLPEKWNALRTFSSTMKNNSNIGRNLNFFLQDDVTGKYLGVICISSDFLDLTPRDKWIGWEREKKTQGGMINFTAIGSTIVPTQPLGFNYVGGKLLALMCLSDTVQHTWKEQYGDTLVGVTTTSLYGKTKAGGLSQYDNLKHWKKMGYSSGSVSYEATRETQYMIRNWLHRNHTRKYFEWYAAKKDTGQPYKRDHRNRSYTFTYTKLGIDKKLISSAHQRGIYFSPLYENTREFLRGEIKEGDLKKLFDTSEEYLSNLWKTKYASKRIKSLVKNDRVSDEILFYDDLIYMSWEEVRENYLEHGRQIIEKEGE
jgi:hypothetical protein